MAKSFFKISTIIFFLFSCNNEDTGTIKPDNPPFLIDYPKNFGEPIIPSENSTTSLGVALGKKLFFDKLLSIDQTISCGSCHIPEFGFSDTVKFSKGIHGQITKRNSPALANLMWQNKFFFDGRANTLEEQSFEPILSKIEMGMTERGVISRLSNHSEYPNEFKLAFKDSKEITKDLISKALAQYMRTLVSSTSKYDKYLKGETKFTTQEILGEQLFFTHPEPSLGLRGANCGDCHVQILTSGAATLFEGFHNNGLDDDAKLKNGLFNVTKIQKDKGKFKTPSLRNIALSAPYMHDGRFNTLKEVLDHYNEHIKINSNLSSLITEASNIQNGNTSTKINLDLTKDEKEAIIAFLKTLTDTNFIQKHKLSK